MQNVIAIVENNWRTGDWNAVGEGYYPLLPYWWHFTRCRSLAVLHTTRWWRLLPRDFEEIPLQNVCQDADSSNQVCGYSQSWWHYECLHQWYWYAAPNDLPKLSATFIVRYYGSYRIFHHGLFLFVADDYCINRCNRNVFCYKKGGGGSAKYFIRQQKALGRVEGFIEEMMNGQKVIKVFCREEEVKKDFDKLNEALFDDARKANRYANI